MSGWDTQDIEEIVVGGRRMRVGRRRSASRAKPWLIALLVVILVGGGVGGYFWFTRTTPADTIPNPAVVAPGGYRADVNPDKTITVGLEVRNTANIPVTLLEARIVAPAGLTSTALTIIPSGSDNEGFSLDGDLPPSEPVQLGTDDSTRNAIIAARFTVNCDGLLATGAALTEEIYVIVKVGDEQREEGLTSPVVDDEPWLTATAKRACLDPVPTVSAEPPLPPLPDDGPSPDPSATP